MAGETDGREDTAAAAAAVGVALRGAREARGASLADCAAALRARTEQLVALEAGRLETFGGDVYARGFVRSYARLVGLDPAPLLERLGRRPGEVGVGHLRELPTERRVPRPRTPAWAVTLLVLVVAGAVVAAVLRLGGARTPDVALPPATPPSATAPAPEPAAPADPPPAPAPAPAPPAAPVELVLTLEAASWLQVVVDGVVVERATVAAGETRRYEAEAAILVQYGNAGGVRVELNGAPLGRPGAPGAVVRVGYGPDGVLDALPTVDATG